jgi:integrase
VQDAVTDFRQKGLKGRTKGTIDNYRSLADHNVIPQIGGIKVKELTADQLDDWMDERAEELSTRSLRLMHQKVERAIRQAKSRDKVRRNVASLVDVPEGQEDRPSKAMTLGQAVALLETVETGTHGLAAYVVLSLFAGVRTEEARAITWDEVDLKAGTVAVYRSVRVKNDTKTRKSRRVLKLPTKAVQALRGHHTRQAAERLATGEMWQKHDLVFCCEDGTPLDRWHVRKGVRQDHQGRPARRGMDAPRTAALSFVSILSAHDARLEDITDLVGHSSTSVTETVYRHEIRPALTGNATAVNRTLKANATELACPCSGEAIGSPIGSPNLNPKTCLTSRDGGI